MKQPRVISRRVLLFTVMVGLVTYVFLFPLLQLLHYFMDAGSWSSTMLEVVLLPMLWLEEKSSMVKALTNSIRALYGLG